MITIEPYRIIMHFHFPTVLCSHRVNHLTELELLDADEFSFSSSSGLFRDQLVMPLLISLLWLLVELMSLLDIIKLSRRVLK